MQQIDGKTKVCGLIGNPVEHTLSPMIHNTLAQCEGRNMVYVPFPVEQGNLRAAVEGAYALHIAGLNVTVPYKSQVRACLREMDGLAEKIGAVNTLVEADGGYKGYNTDMSGLYRAMESEEIRLEGEEVIILGAGGAARAVAYLCALKKASRVYLLNRTKDKAQAVAQEVNRSFSKEVILPVEISKHDEIPIGKYLAIQATSVGLYPDGERVVIEDRSFYDKVHTGYDLIYKPSRTKFMSLVEEAGGKAYHGLKMLLYQGIIAYELWNHTKVGEAEAQTVYRKMKEALGIRDE